MARLRSLDGALIQVAADRLEATERSVRLVRADNSQLDPRGLNSDGNSRTYAYGNTPPFAGAILINADVGEDTQLLTVAHEALYHNETTHGLASDPGHSDNRTRDVRLAEEFANNGIIPRGYIQGLINDKVPGAERRLKPLIQ